MSTLNYEQIFDNHGKRMQDVFSTYGEELANVINTLPPAYKEQVETAVYRLIMAWNEEALNVAAALKEHREG
jgi:hypothetical protein